MWNLVMVFGHKVNTLFPIKFLIAIMSKISTNKYELLKLILVLKMSCSTCIPFLHETYLCS